jgi:hypothetical protein
MSSAADLHLVTAALDRAFRACLEVEAALTRLVLRNEPVGNAGQAAGWAAVVMDCTHQLVELGVAVEAERKEAVRALADPRVRELHGVLDEQPQQARVLPPGRPNGRPGRA